MSWLQWRWVLLRSCSDCSRRVVWTEGCVSAVGFRVQMNHGTVFIKRPVTWRCFLIWALKLSWILITAGAKWVLACYCGEYWWLDDCISNCCSFLDTHHCSIRSRALRLASKHWFGFAEAIYKISHQATCGWLTWPHHKMRTSLSCLVCVAWGCFPVQGFDILIFFN